MSSQLKPHKMSAMVYVLSLLLIFDILLLTEVNGSSLSKINLRLKRDAEDYDDDNNAIIPDMNSTEYDNESIRDRIREKAEELAESFSKMWSSLLDSVKHAMDALRGLFGDDTFDYELYDETTKAKRIDDNVIVM